MKKIFKLIIVSTIVVCVFLSVKSKFDEVSNYTELKGTSNLKKHTTSTKITDHVDFIRLKDVYTVMKAANTTIYKLVSDDSLRVEYNRFLRSNNNTLQYYVALNKIPLNKILELIPKYSKLKITNVLYDESEVKFTISVQRQYESDPHGYVLLYRNGKYYIKVVE